MASDLVTDFGKTKRTYHLPFQGGFVVTEKSLRWKNLQAWQTIVFVKQENIEKKFNKAYYGENEIVTLVNIFVGGTFPFQQGIFMQSWKGRLYVRSIFPKSVTINQPIE